MKYLILIHGNRINWAVLTEEQRADFGRAHRRLSAEIEAAGELVVSEGLADPALAKEVSSRDGRVTATDGPYAEVKEHLAGLYLIDVDSEERAVEWAGKVPDAWYASVELRPVLDLRQYDL